MSWDVLVDTGAAVGTAKAATSKLELLAGEGVTVTSDLDVVVLVVGDLSSLVTWVVVDGLWSLEYESIKVVGIGEDTEENAMASADTDELAVTVVER